jgi:chromosome segregation ATPase
MSTTPSEQRKAEQKASKDDLVQYVEELAGPEDAWISLTDAARITRTSEAMTRRWVTSGRLKVKKEPVGVPPRTRLVRMSDVAAIRPIVDPTAAITSEVRKLDLPSIPRQQLQIMEDHQRLTKLMQDVLDASKRHEATTHAAFEQVTARLRELSEDLSHRLSTHRDELQRALEKAGQQHEVLSAVVRDQGQQIERSCDELADQARQHQQDLEQLRTDLVGQLHTAQATLQQAQQELERRLIEQAKQVDQVHRDLKEQQEALVTLRRDMTTLVEQQVCEVLTALEQVERDQAQDAAQFHERLEKVEQRIEQVAMQTEAVQITALGYQKRADGQESRLQEVWKLLQGEIAARQALEQQVQQSHPTRKRTT